MIDEQINQRLSSQSNQPHDSSPPPLIIALTFKQIFHELKLLLYLAFPIVLNALIGQTGLVSLYYVGRLQGAKYIGGATLGGMMCNITGYSLMFGMCSALDTLLSQAYGSKSYYLLGLYVQRAMLILTACAIIVVFMWTQTDIVLIYVLGIEPETAKLACIWAYCIAPGLWPNLMFEALKRWLQSQNILWPTIIATSMGTFFNIILNYYFLFILSPTVSPGFEGVALCLALSQWFQLIILVMIITLRKLTIFHIKKSSSSSSSLSIHKARNKNNKSDLKITKLSPSTSANTNVTNTSTTLKSITSNTTTYEPVFQIDHDEDEEESGYDDLQQQQQQHNFDTNISFNGHNNSNHNNNNNNNNNNKVMNHKSHDNISNINNNNSNNNNNNGNSKSVEDEEDEENNFPYSDPAVLDGWPHFLRLGIPGALSMFIEWGSFELAAGIASQLGSVPLAVHGIYMSTAALFYMMPFSISQATTILAGQYVGAGDYQKAKLITHLGITLDTIYGILAGLLLTTILRPYWGPIFTTDPEVQQLLYITMPIMFLYIFVDSTKCITLNILRSTGRPTITVLGNTLVCTCILLPIGYYLAIIQKMGLTGLWLAMSVAWAVATFVYFHFVYYSDWEKLRLPDIVKRIEIIHHDDCNDNDRIE